MYLCVPLFAGPGSYDPRFARDKKGNLMSTKDKRFKEVKTEAPGPGTYEVRMGFLLLGCFFNSQQY